MSGTANRSFSCHGSDDVTFKSFNLNLRGVGVKRSGSDVAVAPNCLKAPFHIENGDPPLTSTACCPFQRMFASMMSQRGGLLSA